MPSIRHLQFGGLRPAVSDKLLPAPYAKRAHNARLRNGELCAFEMPCRVKDESAAHIHLLPDTGELKCSDGCIVPFYDAVCGDAPAVAVYPPDGSSPLRCLPDGAEVPMVPPQPSVAPAVSAVTSNPVSDENGPDARAYVYTWVNQFGYESPPSPPSPMLTGAYNDVYDLQLEAPPADVVCVRVYRMVSAQDNNYEGAQQATSFQLVREIDPAASFTDDVIQADMEFGELLTQDNCPPPQMDCVYETESGYLVGWRGREVYFSERGEPHNWPDRYRFTLPFDIVGGVVNMDSVYLGTTGNPFRIDVAQPQGDTDVATMRVTRYKQRAPLRHKDAIACTDYGAAMSSVGGVWSLDPQRARLATRGRVDEDVWDDEFDPHILEWHRGRLFGAGGPIGGFVLGWQGGEDALDVGDLVTIDWSPTAVHAGTDGELYYAEGGAVWKWDCGPECMEYVWRSPITRTPGLIHWAAVKVVGDFSDGKTATVRVFAGDALYHEELVEEDKIYRVPCSPRDTAWCIEVQGTACVCEVHLATSKAELTERGVGGQNASDT